MVNKELKRDMTFLSLTDARVKVGGRHYRRVAIVLGQILIIVIIVIIVFLSYVCQSLYEVKWPLNHGQAVCSGHALRSLYYAP